ncbi:MAG: DUF2490 domain-containing protein [Acidobacteriia bacterium]|nr:DUF2490 domain-containing protein [Terriglobia bacterium]
MKTEVRLMISLGAAHRSAADERADIEGRFIAHSVRRRLNHLAGMQGAHREGYSTMMPQQSPPWLIQCRRLAHSLRGLVWVALLVVLFGAPTRAQTRQFWPEVDAFVKLNDRMRFLFLATTVKEERSATEVEMGPNFDFYLKRLRDKKRSGGLGQDESKNRLLMVRVGYRYIHPLTGGGSNEQRGVLELTGRHNLVGLLVSDRNRMDFRFIGGQYSWRYRNRLTIEREFSIGRFKFAPYARVEVFHDSRFNKWSRTAVTAGSVFPITKHLELEGYFEHQNDTGGSPNRQVDAVGTVINLYF